MIPAGKEENVNLDLMDGPPMFCQQAVALLN